MLLVEILRKRNRKNYSLYNLTNVLQNTCRSFLFIYFLSIENLCCTIERKKISDLTRGIGNHSNDD